MAMLSRALLDPDHGYLDADLLDYVQRFHAIMAHGESSTKEIAALALSYVARTRRQSDQFARIHFDDTVVDYRDDNRQLWKFIEAGDEEDAFDEQRKIEPGEEIHGLPPRHYPEWTTAARPTARTGPACTKRCIPTATPATSTASLAKHGALAKR